MSNWYGYVHRVRRAVRQCLITQVADHSALMKQVASDARYWLNIDDVCGIRKALESA